MGSKGIPTSQSQQLEAATDVFEKHNESVAERRSLPPPGPSLADVAESFKKHNDALAAKFKQNNERTSASGMREVAGGRFEVWLAPSGAVISDVSETFAWNTVCLLRAAPTRAKQIDVISRQRLLLSRIQT